MKKMQVVEALVAVLTTKLESLEKSLESTRKQARDAPGSNVSHSDTSKFQLSNVALGLSGEVQTTREALTSLRSLPIERKMSACSLGTLVVLRSSDGEERHHLLVAKGGGETAIIDDVAVASLSIGAPLGHACLRKELGDEIECNGKTYVIISIY